MSVPFGTGYKFAAEEAWTKPAEDPDKGQQPVLAPFESSGNFGNPSLAKNLMDFPGRTLMDKTDRQTDKSSRWAFTAFEEQWHYFNDITSIPLVKKWGWQEEICPKTGKRHYQGYLVSQRQVRLTHWVKYLKGVHVEFPHNWDALVNYCKKLDTAVPGTQVVAVNQREYWSMERAYCELTSYWSQWDEYYMERDSRATNPSIKLKYECTRTVDGYWYCVKQVVKKEPFRLSTFAQPQMEKTFVKTFGLYLDSEFRALVLRPEPPGPLRVVFRDEDSPGE